jgi:hypothetical protein
MRVPAMATAILILVAAGSATLALSRQHVGGPPSGHGAQPSSEPVGDGLAADAAVRVAAADWISHQISGNAIVACDPTMCSALQAQGMPGAKLLVLGAAVANPLGAAVVVATPAVRSQFGSRLDSVYAPSVMASFGSGPDQVTVRVIAQDGASAYLVALRQDVAARTAAGAQLLANKRIKLAARAKMQLAAGQVDSRLLIMLPAMTAKHPIQILAFGNPGVGASPGIPLCSADLSGSGRMADMTDAGYLDWLVAFDRAQLAPFAGTTIILRRGDQSIVRVEFSGPSPMGLLAHG